MSRIQVWRRGGDEGSVSLEAAILAPVLIIALLLITVFIAIFSRKFRWDQHEQRYLELMAKKKREGSAEKK